MAAPNVIAGPSKPYPVAIAVSRSEGMRASIGRLSPLRVDPWEPGLALDQEVTEPLVDKPRVVNAPERRPRAGQLVRLVRHAHEAHRPAMRAKDGEELFSLGDGAAQVVLAVLDEERRRHAGGVRQWRVPPVEVPVLPRVHAVLVQAEGWAAD